MMCIHCPSSRYTVSRLAVIQSCQALDPRQLMLLLGRLLPKLDPKQKATQVGPSLTPEKDMF